MASAEGVEIEFKEVNMTVQRRISWLAIATTVACLALFSARAEAKIFMCVEGIEGPSRDDEFKGCIEVFQAGEGVFRRITIAGGIRESTLVSFEEFRVVKLMDITSPLWRAKVALGEVIRRIDFFFTRLIAGDPDRIFWKTELGNVLVSSVINEGIDLEGGGLETLTLNFTNIAWSFFPVDDTGKTLGPIEFKFDLGITDKG